MSLSGARPSCNHRQLVIQGHLNGLMLLLREPLQRMFAWVGASPLAALQYRLADTCLQISDFFERDRWLLLPIPRNKEISRLGGGLQPSRDLLVAAIDSARDAPRDGSC